MPSQLKPSETAVKPAPQETPLQEAVAQPVGWRYLPQPTDLPDDHPESDCRSTVSAENYALLGCRVRGKKHKHEGTHCDDWFHFDTVGPWTIMAVSDGGGSYKFSRLGARTACETAVKQLVDRLRSHSIRPRKEKDEWSRESFGEPDLVEVKEAIVDSFQKAWSAVKDVVVANAENPAYTNILGRPLTERDVCCTLLVAIHVTVIIGDAQTSLVFACAVGDGMISVIDRTGTTRLLMTPDSGEHSGEVRFLDERETQREKLDAKVFPFLGGMRTLMLMSDGVADDYFPNDPGMTLLYGDLVLNGVIPTSEHADAEILAALQATKTATIELVAKCDILRPGEVPTLGGLERPPFPSVVAYAENLGQGVDQAHLVARSTSLLAAASRAGLIPSEADRITRLLKWLDGYYVRGSFDDRTLLMLCR